MNRWRAFKKNPLNLLGVVLLLLILALSIFAPFLSGYSYDAIHLSLKNQQPSEAFWFGTDELGRDLFTRIWLGARLSLFVGISAALIDLCIGMLWGGIAAYAGGWVDELMMRIADLLYSIPYLLVVILFAVALGSGVFAILIALTAIGWIQMARLVRGQILQLKEMEFVMAARALGASPSRILFKHLLPNAAGSILVMLTLTIPSAIFSEAFLSFLGLGVQAPMASLGTMASEGLPALAYYPWRLFFPAGLISLTLLAFNLLGEGLNDAFIRS